MIMHRWNKESYAHKMVAHLQCEMAAALYETLAKKNDFYKRWPDLKEFVRVVAPTLRDHARATLAEMLQKPGVTPEEKEEIYEALLLDKTIPNEDRWVIN